ncbi:hypothetical protein ZIOFF_015744 [Zingiber officinale]|uniref:NOT2/NOT3/NOT5 C-terminal domain-containing protein n=1 Tax=Zingiber officinale TaxID=94328 RepID=A0A8J5HRL8_ZINOF|nr:hypothetical protein ZIOFF_015744 [Zingiber officinale]
MGGLPEMKMNSEVDLSSAEDGYTLNLMESPAFATTFGFLQSLVANEDFQHILRVLNTNVDGKQKIMFALTSIKGIGRRFANIVCKKADVDMNKRAGELSAAELENLMTVVANPRQFKIPDWFLNRKKDYKDGRYSQVVSNALDMKLRDDLERLKKIRQFRDVLSVDDLPSCQILCSKASSLPLQKPPWTSTLLGSSCPRPAHKDHWPEGKNCRCLEKAMRVLTKLREGVERIKRIWNKVLLPCGIEGIPTNFANVSQFLGERNNSWMQSREITDMKGASAISVIEVNQLPTEIDPSHAQPLQPGDTALNSGLTQSQIYNLQLLEAAYHKLPHPRDSEFSCPRRYVPKTYQQYLAARELKRQQWRYHIESNLWRRRNATDLPFDFEYGFLEDDEPVP